MSRAKSKQNVDVCADCGASEPTWASLNRGILLCVQCCSVHRVLGRHISQVKSLQKSNLCPSQLATLQALNAGANHVWEHALLENGSKFAKRKPSPEDTLSIKSAYIIVKHQKLAYAYRPSNEDGLLCVENELGKQLHASVRTNNLDISFRLLTQGADPNYFHDEKGSTPLHNAIKANKIQQCELLIIFGADPTFPDAQGLTPIDCAKYNANKDFASRLIECQYEVTDKFCYYLWHRKPDHQNGIHFLFKENDRKSNPECVARLRKLPNHLFEELVMDVYDEVDRREIEAIWMGGAETSSVACAVAFLPVDPRLSTTRNQSRQKLGRFSSPELMSLVYDILVDTQRRQVVSEKASLFSKGVHLPNLRQMSQVSDDDPLYDSVASDDDYATVPSKSDEDDGESLKDAKISKSENFNTSRNNENDTNSTLELLAKKLNDSDNTIITLQSEVTNLKMLVEHLSSENHELKTRLSLTHNEAPIKYNGDSGCQSLDGYIINTTSDQNKQLTNGRVNEAENEIKSCKKPLRPSSMYETREGLRTPNWQVLKNQLKQSEQNRNITHSLYAGHNTHTTMQCTEQITKGIQQLWKHMQGPNRENCLPCADKIKHMVINLTATLPSDTGTEVVKHLTECAMQLQANCASLLTASKALDASLTECYLHKVRQNAYEIAKDTKEIVTKYSSH